MNDETTYTDLRKVVSSVVDEGQPGVSMEDPDDLTDEDYLLRRVAWIVKAIDRAEPQDFARLQKDEAECTAKGEPEDSMLTAVREAARLWRENTVPPVPVWQKLCQAYRISTPLGRVTMEQMIALFADLSFEVMCLQCQGYLLMAWAETCKDCGSKERQDINVESPSGEWTLTVCAQCQRKWSRVIKDVCGGADGISEASGCGWRKPK